MFICPIVKKLKNMKNKNKKALHSLHVTTILLSWGYSGMVRLELGDPALIVTLLS